MAMQKASVRLALTKMWPCSCRHRETNAQSGLEDSKFAAKEAFTMAMQKAYGNAGINNDEDLQLQAQRERDPRQMR
jgi:hypothetical protein